MIISFWRSGQRRTTLEFQAWPNTRLALRTHGDAVMLHAGVIAMMEAASVEADPGRRKRMLTFVVVGGGFAGVETVGAINDLVRESLPHYGRVDPRELRVVLIGGKAILPKLGEALGVYTQESSGIPKLLEGLEIGEAMERVGRDVVRPTQARSTQRARTVRSPH